MRFCFTKKNWLVFALGGALALLLFLDVAFARAAAAKAENNADQAPQRLAYIQSWGWEVGACVEEKQVLIPQVFSEVYKAYNTLQKQQGFDLEKHKGEQATQYTYELLNYPEKPKNVYLHLLVCNGVVIGGDIACTELEGFMIPFK